MTTRVWVDGALVPADQARISALDLGFRSGVGVFETLRVDHGRTFRLQEHLARLRAGARSLGFEPALEQLQRGIAAVVGANPHLGAHLAVRLTCSPGAIDPEATFPGGPTGATTAVITAQPTAANGPDPTPATAVTTDLRREHAGAKHTSYLVSVLAQQRAEAAGASDALLTATSGAPLEAATANLLLVVDGVVRTPPPGAGILAGVTRTAVLELARTAGLAVVEGPLSPGEPARCDEALLTSAVRGVRALVRVDGRDVGSGRPGPITAHLAAAYHALVTRQGEPLTLS